MWPVYKVFLGKWPSREAVMELSFSRKISVKKFKVIADGLWTYHWSIQTSHRISSNFLQNIFFLEVQRRAWNSSLEEPLTSRRKVSKPLVSAWNFLHKLNSFPEKSHRSFLIFLQMLWKLPTKVFGTSARCQTKVSWNFSQNFQC